MSKKIAIFASGTGSNALKIIEYFRKRTDVEVALVVTNRSDAGVLDHAMSYNIPAIIISKKELAEASLILEKLRSNGIDFIVLAGFLLLIPSFLVEEFDQRIVNIHPALLPKFGGHGMYGSKVHVAVKEAKESESGITIHFVNSKYDEGNIVYQHKVQLTADDTADTIAGKVLTLEHNYFAPVIDHLITSRELEAVLQIDN